VKESDIEELQLKAVIKNRMLELLAAHQVLSASKWELHPSGPLLTLQPHPALVRVPAPFPPLPASPSLISKPQRIVLPVPVDLSI
jgi:hypothetical protein